MHIARCRHARHRRRKDHALHAFFCFGLGQRHVSITRMKPIAVLLAIPLASVLCACTLRPPVSGEERAIDSTPLPAELMQGLLEKPFCLHIRYHNAFFVAMSDTRVEAWVTDGTCATAGARRQVDALRLSWRNDWYDTQNTRQCLQTDICSVNDANVIEGRNIRCASAQARHGDQMAFISTDQTVCH